MTSFGFFQSVDLLVGFLVLVFSVTLFETIFLHSFINPLSDPLLPEALSLSDQLVENDPANEWPGLAVMDPLLHHVQSHQLHWQTLKELSLPHANFIHIHLAHSSQTQTFGTRRSTDSCATIQRAVVVEGEITVLAVMVCG